MSALCLLALPVLAQPPDDGPPAAFRFLTTPAEVAAEPGLRLDALPNGSLVVVRDLGVVAKDAWADVGEVATIDLLDGVHKLPPAVDAGLAAEPHRIRRQTTIRTQHSDNGAESEITAAGWMLTPADPVEIAPGTWRVYVVLSATTFHGDPSNPSLRGTAYTEETDDHRYEEEWTFTEGDGPDAGWKLVRPSDGFWLVF